MGCDTKGIIATNKKDVRVISKALLDVIREIPANPDKDSIFKTNPNLHHCKVWYDPRSDFFTINFKDGDDKRTLWVFLDCDCDDQDVCDKKILLSFGMWGNSGELMKKFLKALSFLGDTYFIENDCGEKGWEKLS
jgi:hypothetical protein